MLQNINTNRNKKEWEMKKPLHSGGFLNLKNYVKKIFSYIAISYLVQPLRHMYPTLEITALSSHFSLFLNVSTESDLCRVMKVVQSTCYLGFLFLHLHPNCFQKGSLEGYWLPIGKKVCVEQASVYLIAAFRLDIRVHIKNQFWYDQAYLVRKVKDGLVVAYYSYTTL